MKLNYIDFLVVILIGFILLLADRYIRIEPFMDVSFCGIGAAPCPFGKRCINGFCKPDTLPILQNTMLPVFP